MRSSVTAGNRSNPSLGNIGQTVKSPGVRFPTHKKALAAQNLATTGDPPDRKPGLSPETFVEIFRESPRFHTRTHAMETAEAGTTPTTPLT